MAASPSEPDLATADLEPVAYLGNASNATILVRVGDGTVHGVYKPAAGERPLWDFPIGTLCRREVAAYLVSEALGWGIVPQTLLRDGPAGPGSVQRFVPHDPREHYFVLVEDPAHHERLAEIALLDLVVNNADRKASHVLRPEAGPLQGCDHGLTFHVEPKLRTVIWELGGLPVSRASRADLADLAASLDDPRSALSESLAPLLESDEIAATRDRAERLTRLDCLPDLPEHQRPYPWPLL